MSPVETDEQIKVPFGVWTRGGPNNHVLDGSWEEAFSGNMSPTVPVR